MTEPTPPKPAPVDLSAAFNDPANKKFRKIWQAEINAVDHLDLSIAGMSQRLGELEEARQQKDAAGEKTALQYVAFWEKALVHDTERIARLKEKCETSTDPVWTEFREKGLTALQPLYDTLAKLDDKEITDGQALFAALTAPEKEPQPEGPLSKGNPFKKGPK